LPAPNTGGEYKTPIERWLSKFAMTDAERSLIFAQSNNNEMHLPEVRALVFPFAEMLFVPIKWIFSLIEAMLLAVIYSIRIIFRWLGIVFWFALQAVLYRTAESLVQSAFGAVDTVILVVLPEFIPPFLIAGVGTAIGISALKSYWYSVSFWGTLKLIFLVRFALWAIWTTINHGLVVCGVRRDRRKRQH
jgi:hypothetical protein